MTRRAQTDIPTPDPALLADLRRVARRLRSRERDEQERLRLVGLALDAGWTHAQVADAAGLTRGRIGQIAQRVSALSRG